MRDGTGVASGRNKGQMQPPVKAFTRSEDGAIAVDWIVLTTLIVALQVALLLTPVREALVSVSETTLDKAAEANVALND